MESGNLKINGSIVADVDKTEKKNQIFDDGYESRLQWNSSSGCFSLNDLQMTDSGRHSPETYYLTVYGKTQY